MAIPSRSRLLRWSAAVVILGLLGLGGVELFFRSFPEHLPTAAQFRLHDRALSANPINSLPDEEIGYLWRPHLKARYRGFEFGFDYSTDAHGFRNPGPWPDRADIVVLGDSEAFAFGVDDGEEWVQRMAQRMPGVRVVNLGLLGAAPQQFEKIYQTYGRPLRPEVVLVALFPSNALTMEPLFDQWRADGKPDRFDLRRARGGAPADQDALAALRDRLRDSYAVLAVHHGLRSLLGIDGLHTMTFADGGRVRLVEERYGGAAAAAAAGQPGFTRVIDALERLHAAVRADGAEMVVLPFPTKEEVHLPLLGVRPHELVAPFRRALEQRGIPCLDLTPALQREAAAGRNLFLEVDLHPNAAGEAVIGGLVSDYLERTLAASALAARRPDGTGRPLRSSSAPSGRSRLGLVRRSASGAAPRARGRGANLARLEGPARPSWCRRAAQIRPRRRLGRPGRLLGARQLAQPLITRDRVAARAAAGRRAPAA